MTAPSTVRAADAGLARVRYAADLVTHLVAREFKLRYRNAWLGWAWVVAQPLARLAVLTLVFTRILPLGIDDYPVFLFSGLIAWMWFSSGVLAITGSVAERRDLFFRPGIPRATVPLVSALTTVLDYVAALPVLLAFIVLGEGLPWTALALPGVLLVQLGLVLGVGYLTAAANVYLRDVRLLVEVSMMLGFYVTPVFYDLSTVPDGYVWLLRLNPMTHLLAAHRAVLIEGRLPSTGSFVAVTLVSAVILGLGYLVYRVTSSDFVDEL